MDSKKLNNGFALTALASSLLMMQTSAYGLQEMNEQDLRKIDGRDGISLSTSYDSAEIDQVYWQDNAGTASDVEKKLRANLNTIKIKPQTGGSLSTEYKINVGSGATTAGVDLNITSNIGTISAEKFNICNGSSATDCGSTMGSVAIQGAVDTPINFGLTTSDGLFNSTADARLQLGLKNLNIYIGQKESPTLTNQLVLKNFNFNFDGFGKIFIDNVQGLRLETGTNGYVDLTRVIDPQYNTGGTFAGTNSGLNLEFMINPNAGSSYTTNTAKGLIRVGASGRIANAYLQVRGINASGLSGDISAPTNNIFGYATNSSTIPTTGNNISIIGSSGIALRMRGEFTADGDAILSKGSGGQATTLELGGAGKNSYGLEFGNLSAVKSRSTDPAYFDSGNVYINLVDTKQVMMPQNSVLNNAKIGTTYITQASDYTQTLHDGTTDANPYSVLTGIRGMDFQAIARRGRFIVSNDVASGAAGYIAPTAGKTNTWGIGLPIYNLNANLALYGTTYSGSLADGTIVNGSERLGFSAAISTTGRDSTGSKTTSILVVDGAANPLDGGQPRDFYFGLRNIDMYLKGNGTIGFEQGKLNVNMPKVLLTAAAEVAAGYLPGAKYAMCSSGGTTLAACGSGTSTITSPNNNFNLSTDVLFGLRIKLNGKDMNFALVPSEAGSLSEPASGASKLGFVGNFTLTDGAVQIVDPVNQSILGLDNISGKVKFDNSIVINKDNAVFNLGFDFNPGNSPTDVFRVKDINFYPANGAAQRLGEMVITGGNLASSMSIKPR